MKVEDMAAECELLEFMLRVWTKSVLTSYINGMGTENIIFCVFLIGTFIADVEESWEKWFKT